MPVLAADGELMLTAAAVRRLGADRIGGWNKGVRLLHDGSDKPLGNARRSEQLAGEGQPESDGLGFGNGLVGLAESGASLLAGPAVQEGFQLVLRTVGFLGQLGAIGVEGLLSTFLPADSPLSNFTNTLPGKLLAGLAGVRPMQPNMAGQTKPPLPDKDTDKPNTHIDTQNHVGAQFNAPVYVKGGGTGFVNTVQKHVEATRSITSPSGVPA